MTILKLHQLLLVYCPREQLIYIQSHSITRYDILYFNVLYSKRDPPST